MLKAAARARAAAFTRSGRTAERSAMLRGPYRDVIILSSVGMGRHRHTVERGSRSGQGGGWSLTALDVLRDEHGFAASNTRHPEVLFHLPWPVEAEPGVFDLPANQSKTIPP